MMDQNIIIAAISGYFLGAIPFGLLLARLAGQGDIRKIGSGNIGATNVLRTGRKDIAILTLIFDAGKAAAAVLIFRHLFGNTAGLIAGGAALIGHCYPVWLKFKGGKGVATYFGVLLIASWKVGLLAAIIWLTCAFLTRIVSLSGIITAIIAPIIAYFMGYIYVAVLCLAVGLVIIIRHHENIGRIFKGTESKISKKQADLK
ncbi:MAG: glycerol-3-phosphate 1-O-acyltransferase PlsY [Robiginitomaculum sp.]